MAITAQKIQGGMIQLFLNKKTLAFAKSCNLSVNVSTTNVSNKDEGGGTFQSEEPSTISWSCSSDNMFSQETYDTLMDICLKRQKVNVVVAKRKEADTITEVPTGGTWTAEANNGYTGSAFITSVEMTANNGDFATFSVKLQGTGALTKVSA